MNFDDYKPIPKEPILIGIFINNEYIPITDHKNLLKELENDWIRNIGTENEREKYRLYRSFYYKIEVRPRQNFDKKIIRVEKLSEIAKNRKRIGGKFISSK